MFKMIHTLVADEEAVAMVCAGQVLSMGRPFSGHACVFN